MAICAFYLTNKTAIKCDSCTPSAVHDKPLIHPCHAPTPVTPSPPAPSASPLTPSPLSDDRGDLLIRGLWSRGTDCILDVRITDTDAKTYQSKDPLKVLASHEKNKKKKYLAPCLAQPRHFTPFVVSADGLLGHEADAVVCKLAFTYAEKTDKPYSVVCGFMRNRISIAILRATHRCLQGSRIPSGCMSSPHP